MTYQWWSPSNRAPHSNNLVDEVWGEDRPPLPDGEIAVQPMDVSGAAAAEKLTQIRERLTEAGADATVVTALDEIMWLFNIRGNPADIDFNPVIMSYALVTVEPPTARSHTLSLSLSLSLSFSEPRSFPGSGSPPTRWTTTPSTTCPR